MGLELLDFFKSKLKKEYKIAFFTTFIITLLVHLYKFTNALPNNDSIMNYYSNQNVLASGRWALSFSCGLSSYYDLPWIIGLFSCIFIALTAVVIVALFKVKNPVVIGLIGALIGTSPATTETFFFLFTADGYTISMLLASLGVYFSRIDEKRNAFSIASILCICVSCGIYQAYVSFSLILAVCYFIDILLQNKHTKEECTRWIFKQIIIYSVSLLSYFVIWKLMLYLTGTIPNDYQGISKVGKLNFRILYIALKSSIKSFILFFVQNNVFKDKINAYTIFNIIFIILMIIIMIVSISKEKLYLRKRASILFVLCLISIIPFSCIWCFTSEGVAYRAMMLQSMTILYIYTVILYERYAKINVKNFACVFFIAIVINNSLIANINYFYLNLCYENTYAEGLEIVMRIHQLQDEYKMQNIAVFGERTEKIKFEMKDIITNDYVPAEKDFVYGKHIYRSLLTEKEKISNFLEVNYGLKLEPANETTITQISKSEEFNKMKCWPSKDSMKVIDGTLVIKFNDE